MKFGRLGVFCFMFLMLAFSASATLYVSNVPEVSVDLGSAVTTEINITRDLTYGYNVVVYCESFSLVNCSANPSQFFLATDDTKQTVDISYTALGNVFAGRYAGNVVVEYQAFDINGLNHTDVMKKNASVNVNEHFELDLAEEDINITINETKNLSFRFVNWGNYNVTVDWMNPNFTAVYGNSTVELNLVSSLPIEVPAFGKSDYIVYEAYALNSVAWSHFGEINYTTTNNHNGSDTVEVSVVMQSSMDNTTDDNSTNTTDDTDADTVQYVKELAFGNVVYTLNDNIITGSVTIKNKWNYSMNNIALSLTGLEAFGMQMDASTISLSAGQTKTIKLSGTLPSTFNTGTYACLISASFEDINASKNVDLIINGGLDIINVDVDWDEDSENDVSENRRIGDFLPGNSVTVDIEVRNLFARETNIQIDDVEVELTINNIDGSRDIEEETRRFDIDAGDKEEEGITFDIPWAAEDDDYSVVLVAKGTGDNGQTFTDRFNFKIEVKRDGDEVRILSARFTPESVSCFDRVRMSTDVINLGEDDMDVVVVFSNKDLGVSMTKRFNLDKDPDRSDNRQRADFEFNADPAMEPGEYKFDVVVVEEGHGYTLSAVKVPLEIKSCSGSSYEKPDWADGSQKKSSSSVVFVGPSNTASYGSSYTVASGMPQTEIVDLRNGHSNFSSGQTVLLAVTVGLLIVLLIAGVLFLLI